MSAIAFSTTAWGRPLLASTLRTYPMASLATLFLFRSGGDSVLTSSCTSGSCAVSRMSLRTPNLSALASSFVVRRSGEAN